MALLTTEAALTIRAAIHRNLTDMKLRRWVSSRAKLDPTVFDRAGSSSWAFDQYCQSLAMDCRTAQVVIWEKDIWNAALKDADKAFPTCQLDMTAMQTGSQLWLFHGVHLALGWLDEDGRSMSIDGIFVRVTSTEVRAVIFMAPSFDWKKDDPPTYYIRDCGIIRAGHVIDAMWSSFLAARYFLNLKIVALNEHLPHNKSQRRRLQQQLGDIPDIRVITLRRVEQKTTEYNAASVEWQHHWIVSGHWRKQWFPSQREHRPVYIAPYVKGPLDKPIMPLRESIFRAVR